MRENLLSVSQVHKQLGGRLVLQDVSLGLDQGERLGLIGDNGAGKSTLLRLLTGDLTPDRGQVVRRQGLRLAYLQQRTVFSEPTGQAVLEAPFAPLRAALAAYEQAVVQGQDSSAWSAQIAALGGWEWQHHIARVAQQLQLADLQQPVASLSGGQQKRLALAQLLLQPADVWLLDEPTNHLDLQSIAWLEHCLQNAPQAVLVITHDRYFLEATVQRMAELRHGQLQTYQGSYQAYVAARAQEEALQVRTEARRAQILQAEIAWARRAPQARGTKQKARLARLDAAQAQQANAPRPAALADFALGSRRLGRTILQLEAVSLRYPEAPAPLFAPFSLQLTAGERWGIVGPNGTGKSSLLQLIAGALAPETLATGRVQQGQHTQLAYLAQQRPTLRLSARVAELFLPQGGDSVCVDGKMLHLSRYLNRFAFAADAHLQRVEQLSGGEKSRLALALFLLTPANLLLLDEPTNDLDLLTLSILEDALQNFAGCLLVVSHDRYFLDKVVTGVLGLQPQSHGPAQVVCVQGDYQRYQAYCAAQAVHSVKSPTVVPRPKPPSRGVTPAQKRQLSAIEKQIAVLESQVAELQKSLSDTQLWQGDGTAGKTLQATLTQQQHSLATLYARWEALSLQVAAD